ncbi:sulfite exporter TauE/SafE family protein [Candidatus Woesearchaeota archaeon]|nr:sulfite exporter TauE/SafE family protein [Candidatus Woesearchaeota archaeon]
MKTEKFIAKGTTCESCATIIKRQAEKVEGVEKVNFSYETEEGEVTYDPSKTDIDEILFKIEEKGYECLILDDSPAPKTSKKYKTENKTTEITGWIVGAIGIGVLAYFLFQMVEGIQLPQLTQGMSYGLILVGGLLTGFHCVAMCGGFVVSYCAKDAKEGRKSHKSHFMYGFGKTISYTIIGAMFGLLGSFIAFTPQIRGIAGLLAGLFLIIFGLKMLNVFPKLRRFGLHTPKGVTKFVAKEQKNTKSPLVIGLLNGLMIACGPLQAIYIMAAGTGSMIEGAKILFLFGLGTLPVLLGFGFITSLVSRRATTKILKASAFVVILLGLIMVNRGLALSGSGLDTNTLTAKVTATSMASDEIVKMEGEYQVIEMNVTRYGWEPDKFVLQKDVPVKWKINGLEVTGCNNAIQVPEYNLKFDIKKGMQTIEFTPTKEGVVPWSCWMGMIPGTFIVKEDLGSVSAKEIQQEIAAIPQASGGCGCGGGSAGGTCGV